MFNPLQDSFISLKTLKVLKLLIELFFFLSLSDIQFILLFYVFNEFFKKKFYLKESEINKVSSGKDPAIIFRILKELFENKEQNKVDKKPKEKVPQVHDASFIKWKLKSQMKLSMT